MHLWKLNALLMTGEMSCQSARKRVVIPVFTLRAFLPSIDFPTTPFFDRHFVRLA